MSAELWRVIQDLETAFVAVSCSHVSASIVELLMPQYSADRNKALQMLEGIVGVAFHWMLGVQLFRLLVPLRYHNFPGTVFTVFAPLLLRQQYTKLLVAVQGIAGQALRLLPSTLGDESTPRKGRSGTAVQPLPVDMSQWQQALDDLEASIITDMREVMAQAQAAYVAGSKERLEAEEEVLKGVFSEGVAQITSLLQQGNSIAQQQLDMAIARRDTVAQWQLSEKLKAFKDAAQRMASKVATTLTAIEQSLSQMKAALYPLLVYTKNISSAVDEWRAGGPPFNAPDDPVPPDPSDPDPPKPKDLEYPYPTGSGQSAGYVMGETTESKAVLMGRMEKLYLASTDKCGQYSYAKPLPLLYLYDPASKHVVAWDNLPKFADGSVDRNLLDDYHKGLVVVHAKEVSGKCWYPQQPRDCKIAHVSEPETWIDAPEHPARFSAWTPRQALHGQYPYRTDGTVGVTEPLYYTAPFVN